MLKEIPIDELCERYSRLYSAIVYDVLEEMGFPDQALANDINPLKADTVVAGPAFTIKSAQEPDRTREKDTLGFSIFRRMYPHCVAVVNPGNDTIAGHWGELTSTVARANGCAGAVVNGGTRDALHILRMNFPTFVRYTSPVEAFGRVRVIDIEIPIYMPGATQNVIIHPRDFVFGDMTEVVIVPKDIVHEVLTKAEEWVQLEDKVREELAAGADLEDVFQKYHRF